MAAARRPHDRSPTHSTIGLFALEGEWSVAEGLAEALLGLWP